MATTVLFLFSIAEPAHIDLSDEAVREIMEVTVHRVTIRKDMLDIFSTDAVLSKELKFSIIGFDGVLEEGIGVGVNKEVLSIFSSELYTSFCCGADELVPILRHDMQKYEWEAVARIIAYGTTLDFFPIRISRMFMMSALLDESILKKEELISSFLNYISLDEKETIQMFQKEFIGDMEELLEVLSAYGCYAKPTKENFTDILFQLAHKEIIQKPRYIAACWNGVFRRIKLPNSFFPENLNVVYKKITATGKKVASLFTAESKSPEEISCFEHLRRFIKNLSPQSLRNFLRLCTGADVITVDKIEVYFISIAGAARRPIFRTCGPILELPNTYTCYSELAEEFQNIMDNPKTSFGFDFA